MDKCFRMRVGVGNSENGTCTCHKNSSVVWRPAVLHCKVQILLWSDDVCLDRSLAVGVGLLSIELPLKVQNLMIIFAVLVALGAEQTEG